MSLYAIEKTNELFQKRKYEFNRISLHDVILEICLMNISPINIMGPDSLFIFLNVENPDCNCEVGRQQFYEQINFAFDNNHSKETYSDKFITLLSQHLLVICKGLAFEWYSQKDNFDFNLLELAEITFSQALSSYEL